MRPTVGQILSGLALGAVAASMLVMPERFIGAENVAVPGLVLQAPAERIVVRAAPIRPKRAHRPAPVKRALTVFRPAPVTVTISRRVSVRPRATPPPPPPARKVVAQRPKPPEAIAPPPPATPELDVASVSERKIKDKGDRRKEKRRNRWRDDDDENERGEDRRDHDREHDGDRDDRDHGDDDEHGDDDD